VYYLPAMARMDQKDGTPGGTRTGAAGYDVVFIHLLGNEARPYSGNGVLVQAPLQVIAAL